MSSCEDSFHFFNGTSLGDCDRSPRALLYARVGKSSFLSLSSYGKSLKSGTNFAALRCNPSTASIGLSLTRKTEDSLSVTKEAVTWPLKKLKSHHSHSANANTDCVNKDNTKCVILTAIARVQNDR
ncbi:hypothetical protein Pcinc_019561 [Petrolisthes cinctipes]|uniref:Uncharacterized protein n=1 Tax=Petrolisthes cinctipes TaxID=88211 RepID=A0AAE1FKQ9_PETCI|nr:hypothetical protein Pcinc_019561 [Petrolisthes cinctipes]